MLPVMKEQFEYVLLNPEKVSKPEHFQSEKYRIRFERLMYAISDKKFSSYEEATGKPFADVVKHLTDMLHPFCGAKLILRRVTDFEL